MSAVGTQAINEAYLVGFSGKEQTQLVSVGHPSRNRKMISYVSGNRLGEASKWFINHDTGCMKADMLCTRPR